MAGAIAILGVTVSVGKYSVIARTNIERKDIGDQPAAPLVRIVVKQELVRIGQCEVAVGAKSSDQKRSWLPWQRNDGLNAQNLIKVSGWKRDFKVEFVTGNDETLDDVLRADSRVKILSIIGNSNAVRRLAGQQSVDNLSLVRVNDHHPRYGADEQPGPSSIPDHVVD